MKRLLLVFIASLLLAQSSTKSGIDRAMLDPACKPCEDFWRYATGGWADAHPIPADEARWGTFNVLRDAQTERLRTILDAAAADSKATGDVRKLGDFYASCLDTAALDAAGTKPLAPFLEPIAAIQTRADLVRVLVAFEMDGLGTYSVGSRPDPDDARKTIASVGMGGMSLPDREYYFQDDARGKEIRDEFLKHVQSQLQNLGDSAESAAAAARTVLAFETVLAKVRPTRVQLRDPYVTLHKMKFADLQALLPEYDWKAAFAQLKATTAGNINISSPDFIKTVGERIRQEPLENWKTWLRWRAVNAAARYLSQPFRDAYFHFDQTVLSGIAVQRPRWKLCGAAADSTFEDTLGRLYVDKFFPPRAQRQMADLIENLRAAFGETLAAADWLESATRKNALRKLESFEPRIGFPGKWRNYEGVTVTRGKYLESTLSMAHFTRLRDASRIGGETDRERWSMTAPTVNASYSPPLNSITFPAGILQFPFFDMDADPAVNYGAIGAVIGHEMGHGFDDQGSKFDADGNLKDWWTEADRAKFELRANCVTQQFDSIDVGNGMHHNGKQVTGEAMGDLGGLTLAYKAYRRSLKGKEAPVMDGFTGDQRFFLAFARVWAGNQRPQAMERQLATDNHPLAKFRANATLQNMPEFRAAFGCQFGDPMVRSKELQCKLW